MAHTDPSAASRGLFGSTFSALAVEDYRRLFFGNGAFQLGNHMQHLIFGWLLLEIGNSPFWLGMGGFAYALSMISIGPIGGALADAWERRRVMLLTQGAAVVVNASIALLYWLGWLGIPHLLLASLAMGCAFSLNMPARQSLLAEILPRRLIHNATALHTAAQNLSRVVGPLLAGSLLAWIGALPVLLINLTANSWTVRQLTEIRYRPSRPPRPFRFDPGELLGGFRYAWRERALFEILLIVAVADFFGLSFVYLLPSLARDTLRAGPQGLGLLTASMGGGALLGALLQARLPAPRRKDLALAVAATALGLMLVLLGRAEQLGPAVMLTAITGLTTSVVTACGLGAIQERIPDELSGRVFGIYMLIQGFMPLGSLPSGALAAQLGTANAISVWGAICAAASAALLVRRQLQARPRQLPLPSS